jgi:uncharacterized protein (TIGR01777 family)
VKTTLEFKSKINCSASELFEWHAREGAFERLTPSWEPVRVIERKGKIYGELPEEVKLEINLGLASMHWHLKHIDCIPGKQFSDTQISGPFHYYKHDHLVEALSPFTSLLIDRLEFELPFGLLGNVCGGFFIKPKLERLFRYRHQITKLDLEAAKLNKKGMHMKILISGSSGLVGKDLCAFLVHQGHDVHKLIRDKAKLDDKSIYWNPETAELNAVQLEGFDAVINLAGENIAAKRWTKEQKTILRDSRIKSTQLLSETLAKLNHKPKVLISASAIGFYGDRPNEMLHEAAMPAKGDYLSDLCQDWEAAANAARDAGMRVVHPRFGIILSPKGGAMSKLLTPFQMGAGGIIGNGKQVMSWIALDDVIYALHYLLMNDQISGAVNFTSPNPATNSEFTTALGKVLSRPTIFPVPSFAAKLVFGEMADALLLSSTKAKPEALLEAGFKFSYPKLEEALRHLLGK